MMWIDPFLRLAAIAIALLPCVTVAAPTHEILRDGSVLISNGKHGPEKRTVHLDSWAGCEDPQKNAIINAWRNMVEMAEKIKPKIDFEEQVAVDFFGDPKLNAKYQNDIRLLIQDVTTWKMGNSFSWQLHMKCNDPLHWDDVKKNNNDPAYKCPPGTAVADWDKCNSRCWHANTNEDGSVRKWVYRAVAYTDNSFPYEASPIATMNWCPKWFDLPNAVDAYDKYSKSRTDDKWDLNNYICKESTMMHELMHVDRHSRPATNERIMHIADRKMKIRNTDFQRDEVIKAYGPLYAKVLANFAARPVGLFVATNADSLALYFLGKWVQVHGGYYPSNPRTNGKPIESPQVTDPIVNASEGDLPPDTAPPGRDETEKGLDRVPAAIDTPDQWDPITIKDGKVATGDINDLASALGLGHDTADVGPTFVFADPDLDCLDLNGTQRCYTLDDDKNAEIELDSSVGFLPPVSPAPKPTPKRGALNIILEQTDWDYGEGVLRREMKWLLYPTAFGTASQCSNNPEPATVASNVPNTVRGIENGYMTRGCPILFNEDLTKKPDGCNGPNYINQIPYPAGVYNVGIDGQNCEYKNDGQNNAGALYCGNNYKSSCKAHDDKEKANLDGAVTCDNLSHPSDSVNKKPAKRVSHRAVVACEW